MYELLYWPDADEALGALEAGPNEEALMAVTRTLARLETDPYNPRLLTRVFITQDYGGVRATPAQHDNWFIFWLPGQDEGTVEIVLIHELDLSR